MGGLWQGSLARRVAVSAFALYALLLQGFLAASAPAAAFTLSDGINCTESGSGPGTSGGHPAGHHHGLCCIVACAAAACAYTRTDSAFVVFPARIGSKIDFA